MGKNQLFVLSLKLSTLNTSTLRRGRKMMQNSRKKTKMETRPKPKILHFEDYDFFINNPLASSTLNIHQPNQIVEMHGFLKLNHENRRKALVVEALSGIDNLMNTYRSTLNDETLISSNNEVCFTVDEVNADLDALQWREFTVQHFRTLCFDNSSDKSDNVNVHLEKLQPKRVSKEKEKKAVDRVRSTRRRSMKIQKRKNINEIGLSACLV